MSGIEELRQRVMDAEECFGSNDAQRAEYSARLIGLMNAVEGRIRQQQDEIALQAAIIEKHEIEAAAQQTKIDGQSTAIAQQAGEIESLKTAGAGSGEENEQLRDMLHALLQAIETGGRDGLAEAMQELDRMASALVDPAAAAPVAETAAEESIEQSDEPPAKAAIAVGPVSIAPFDEDEDPAGIEDTAIVEPALEEVSVPVAEETREPGAEKITEPDAEAELPVTEEIEEPATEDALELELEEIVELVAEASEDSASETTAATNVEASSGSLDEIMERVSKLVEETEAAIAFQEPCAPEATSEATAAAPADAVPEDLAEAFMEEPVQQATGTGS